MAIQLLVLASTLYLPPKDTYVSVFKSAITASCTNKCPVILMNSLRRRLIPDSGFYFEPRILTVQRYPCATQPSCSSSLHYHHHHRTSTAVSQHTWWGLNTDESSDIPAKLNCRLHPRYTFSHHQRRKNNPKVAWRAEYAQRSRLARCKVGVARRRRRCCLVS